MRVFFIREIIISTTKILLLGLNNEEKDGIYYVYMDANWLVELDFEKK